ncbi:MAG: MarR family transcriptional regulator [Candidatus Caldarchaeum sp.]
MVKPEHEVEEALSSYLHIRVIKALASSPEPCTRYMLAKACGISQRTAENILQKLLKHGWVVQTPYKPAKYTVNPQKHVLKKLLEFFNTTGYMSRGME